MINRTNMYVCMYICDIEIFVESNFNVHAYFVPCCGGIRTFEDNAKPAVVDMSSVESMECYSCVGKECQHFKSCCSSRVSQVSHISGLRHIYIFNHLKNRT
jgi:hypothetical protein